MTPTCPDCGSTELTRSTCRTVQGGEVDTYVCACGHEDAVTSRVWRPGRCVGCNEMRWRDAEGLCRPCAESCTACGSQVAPHENDHGELLCGACRPTCGRTGCDAPQAAPSEGYTWCFQHMSEGA